MTFDGTQKVIGNGAQAEVLLYKGFAYKVYKPTYPAEWIAFEKQQQAAVNKAGLCPVKYYDTDDPHIIKMDFVDGDTLEKKLHEAMPFEDGLALLAHAFRFVHAADATNTTIPPLIATAGMGLSDAEQTKILPVIERLSQKYKSVICHLDMHFLNIMIPKTGTASAQVAHASANSPQTSGYIIIDWMNTRLAPAVFDYARTYVVFDEFIKDALVYYKNAVSQDINALGISDEDFSDAVEVCTIIRKHEK
jgi:hypothetical protein